MLTCWSILTARSTKVTHEHNHKDDYNKPTLLKGHGMYKVANAHPIVLITDISHFCILTSAGDNSVWQPGHFKTFCPLYTRRDYSDST